MTKFINVKSDGFWKDSSESSSESFIFNNTVIYYVSKSMLCLLSRFSIPILFHLICITYFNHYIILCLNLLSNHNFVISPYIIKEMA